MKNWFLFALFFTGIVHAAIDVDFFRDFDDAQGTNGIYYMNTSNYFTEAQMGWNGTAWNASNYGLCHFQQQTNGRIVGAIGTGCFPVLEWVANETGFVRLNGSLKSFYSGLGSGMKVWIRKDNQLISFVPIAANVSSMNFGYNLTVVVGSTISLVFDMGADASYDDFYIDNLTIKAHGFYPAHERFYFNSVDELNNGNKTVNVSIQNETNTTLFIPSGNFIFNKTFYELPSGNVYIETRNNTCLTTGVIPRSFYRSIYQGGFNQTVYLLCDGSSPIYARINVWSMTQQPIANVTVQVYKVLTTGNALISNGITSGNGLFGLYLQTNDRYVVVASKTGYTPVSAQILASQNDFYFIMPSAGSANVTNIFEGVGRTIRPSVLSLPNSTAATIEFNVTTNGSTTVDWFCMNVTYANGTGIFFYNNTALTGGNITAFIDTTNISGKVYAAFNISRLGYPLYNESYYFTVMNWNTSTVNQSLKGFNEIMGNSTVGRFVRATIALGVTFLLAAAVAPFSTFGAGMVAILSIGYFTFIPNTFVLQTDTMASGLGVNAQWALYIIMVLVILAVSVRKSGF